MVAFVFPKEYTGPGECGGTLLVPADKIDMDNIGMFDDKNGDLVRDGLRRLACCELNHVISNIPKEFRVVSIVNLNYSTCFL